MNNTLYNRMIEGCKEIVTMLQGLPKIISRVRYVHEKHRK